jgi:hypothetical protein
VRTRAIFAAFTWTDVSDGTGELADVDGSEVRPQPATQSATTAIVANRRTRC